MDKLEEKYKAGDITLEELAVLRSQVMSMGDELLERRMLDDWQNGFPEDDHAVDERLVVVKERIDERLFGDREKAVKTDCGALTTHTVRKLRIPWGWIAAAVIVPFFMLTTFYFYRSASSMASGEAVFATSEGQHAELCLPDGTAVTMNGSSSLSYCAGDFNTMKRDVDFKGEAYFDVSKNKEVPFVIHSGDMTVKVLGTKFNFEAYPDRSKAVLSLDEGKVEISSGKECRLVEAGQVATLDYSDGSISVVGGGSADASAWMKHEFVFRGMPLAEVLNRMEAAYGVRIHVDDTVSCSDTFSGSVPSNNLVDALEIVKISYGLNYRFESKEIYFYKK